MKYKIITGILVVAVLLLAGCGEKQDSSSMQDGTYTAQMEEYSHGWREFVTITVKNGVIVTAEYNAENSSGFIKSWDNAYMNNMKTVTGTYPNEYTRYYANQLLTGQGEGGIDAISGATSSHGTFQMLARAVLEQSRKGDSGIIYVSATSS